jgi:hypothetical protein
VKESEKEAEEGEGGKGMYFEITGICIDNEHRVITHLVERVKRRDRGRN